MQYIEIVSEGYTYRHDFTKLPSTKEVWDHSVALPVEDLSSADFALSICLDLLRCAFGAQEVRKALMDLDEVDY